MCVVLENLPPYVVSVRTAIGACAAFSFGALLLRTAVGSPIQPDTCLLHMLACLPLKDEGTGEKEGDQSAHLSESDAHVLRSCVGILLYMATDLVESQNAIRALSSSMD